MGFILLYKAHTNAAEGSLFECVIVSYRIQTEDLPVTQLLYQVYCVMKHLAVDIIEVNILLHLSQLLGELYYNGV